MAGGGPFNGISRSFTVENFIRLETERTTGAIQRNHRTRRAV